MLKNPFVIYILSFGGVLAAYQLGWSQIYPNIALDLLLFFGLTFAVSGTIALTVSDDIKSTKNYTPGLLPKWVPWLFVIGGTADISYSGGVPLLQMIDGTFVYGSFTGIPTLHVFVGTFAIAYSAIRCADLLYATGSRARAQYLFEMSLSPLFFLLIVYRGPIVICAVSWAFVFIIKHGRIDFRRLAAIAVLGLGLLYCNGVMGEARSPGGAEQLGLPTKAFEESGIPRSYFWTYLYLTAPLANLQMAVDDDSTPYAEPLEFFVSEMLPDFISNRVLPMFDMHRIPTPEVAPGLNVAGLYGRSYVYYGWVGAIAMFIWFLFSALAYLGLILRSTYRVPCLALLNTMVVFSTFENMIAYTALSFVLVWPLILDWRLAAPPAQNVPTDGRSMTA
jgi:hypothetical protein